MARMAVRIIVTGRVQGVGFRAFVRRHATALGIDGWVRNRRDGSVEILAIGEPDPIDRLVTEARTGPRMAKVEGVEIDATETGDATGFHEQPTV